MAYPKTLSFIPEISKKQVTDTGLLIALLCLLLALYSKSEFWLKAALAATALNLLVPKTYYPLAVLWLSFGKALGHVTSLILLTVLFVVLVVPLALLKRLSGKDELRLKAFKRGNSSVFTGRDHVYEASDLHHPF